MKVPHWFSPNFRAEKITFFVFAVLYIAAICIHDPWFDEMQAWLIAKTASWHDLLFVLPHYEGHPPFFHLLLSLPARLGVPWQIGLRMFCALSTLASAYLILFKAPFARWIRLALPFTFFIFYEYGVLARPYNLMWLFVIGAAISFPKRTEKPLLFVFWLALLSMCHLFGLAVAGGIAGVWLWEIRGIFGQKKWYSDKRLWCLAGLLAFAILILSWINPAQQSAVREGANWLATVERFPSLLYILPGDVFLTDIYKAVAFPSTFFYLLLEKLLMLTLQGLLWWILFSFLPKGKKEYILLPGMLLLFVMSFYVARHHIGIFGMVFLFAFWVSYADKTISVTPSMLAKKLGKWVVLIGLLVSITWTACSVYHDIKYSSFPGKEVLSFLREHQLDKLHIMGAWCKAVDDGCKTNPQTSFNNFGAEFAFYANKNLIYNYNYGSDKLYRQFTYTTPEQKEYDFAQWRKIGLPDVVLSKADLDSLFEGENLLLTEYEVVYQIQIRLSWKMNIVEYYVDNIYVRKDLLKEHHLEPLEDLLFVFG